jgi:mannose-6-phosphate isomerase class I
MENPGLYKLEPAVVNKPWGLVHADAMDFTGIRVGVGEFWLASAQTGPGNYSNTVIDPALHKTLADVLAEAAREGDDALARLIGADTVRMLRENPHRGKTEAWYVRAVEGRTGVACGPRTAEEIERLKALITTQGLEPDVDGWSTEVRDLMGLIEPLKGGEIFLVPAGTLHTMFAVGPDSKLIIDELQQGYGEALLPTLSKILMVQDNLLSVQVHPNDKTVADAAEGRLKVDQDLQANPTVRLYDFGRRPGERPELGFSLLDPETGMRRAQPVTVQAAPGHSCEVILAGARWVKARTRLEGGRLYDLAPCYGSYRVLHFLEGEAEILVDGRAMAVHRGETVFVPACLEGQVRIEARVHCAFFDDAFPTVTVLTRFLGTRGAGADQIEALLSPPKAR